MDDLITAADLAARLDAPNPPVVLDVRWSLGGPHGHAPYVAGHIPGALFVDLEADLAAHGAPTKGRHPLPDAEAFQASARRWGLDDGDEIVVYDDDKGWGAARAWWMLTDAGVSTRVLDGGLAAWRAAGYSLEEGDVVRDPGFATLHPGHRRQLTVDEAAALGASADGILLDARAGERYRGETEPIDPRAGHIPGAVSAPTTENVRADGTFLGADELRGRFADLGIDPGTALGVYCGSGVSAAHEILALAVAGHDAALYPGSWSQWANLPERPVATGATP